jgi:hypothetical protein
MACGGSESKEGTHPTQMHELDSGTADAGGGGAMNGDGDSHAGDGDTATKGDGDAPGGDGDKMHGDGDAPAGDGDAPGGDGDTMNGDGDAPTGDAQYSCRTEINIGADKPFVSCFEYAGPQAKAQRDGYCVPMAGRSSSDGPCSRDGATGMCSYDFPSAFSENSIYYTAQDSDEMVCKNSGGTYKTLP